MQLEMALIYLFHVMADIEPRLAAKARYDPHQKQPSDDEVDADRNANAETVFTSSNEEAHATRPAKPKKLGNERTKQPKHG
jgi:hypothetical protein